MILFAFDRDGTVSSSEDPGPVPLEWLKILKHTALVYAIGNPKLGVEAGIPDHREIKRRVADKKTRIIEPDWKAWRVIPEEQRANIEGKFRRLSRLTALHPEPMIRLVIDDFPLYRMPGWTWWRPSGFFNMGLRHWQTESERPLSDITSSEGAWPGEIGGRPS